MFVDNNPEIILINGKYKYKKTNKIVDKKMIHKIKKLGIPPAYNRFWIAKDSNSNIQAISLDSKNRKQYFYHSNWINKQTNKKYIRMYKFMKKMPLFWKTIDKDLKYTNLSINKLTKFSKRKVMAAMFKIMKYTNIRIGNKKYLDSNNSIGLTTLKKEHLKINNNDICLIFKGKSGIQHNLVIINKDLVNFIKELHKTPGDWLMQYQNSKGEFIRINSADMNAYLQSIIGKEFTCKDFRTHSANINFLKHIQNITPSKNDYTKTELKSYISKALELTAKDLGHNKTTSKNSYVNEKLLDEYLKFPLKIKNDTIEKTLLKIYHT